MSLNYYEILEISRNSNQEEIANAFRRLALKYHPQRNDAKDFATNNKTFHAISEAYEVISDRKFLNFKILFSFFFKPTKKGYMIFMEKMVLSRV